MSGVALSWSGGKDSALALWAMGEELATRPTALLTTFVEDTGRVAMHGVRAELIRAQAEAVGLPLVEVAMPAFPPNRVYEERLAAALAAPALAGVETIAFADLYLADIRAYREQRLAAVGRRAMFPLWGRDTADLARAFIDAGFEATLVCVDTEQLDGDLVGRRFDATLLDQLPAGGDPCGEGGEFHTFVSDGPPFAHPIEFEPAERTADGRFAYQDLRQGPA